MKTLFCILFLSLSVVPTFAQEDNPRLKEAESIYSNFTIETIGARGAVQVSQMADMAQMKYSRMLIAQNEEIITLLKQIAAKPVTSTAIVKSQAPNAATGVVADKIKK